MNSLAGVGVMSAVAGSNAIDALMPARIFYAAREDLPKTTMKPAGFKPGRNRDCKPGLACADFFCAAESPHVQPAASLEIFSRAFFCAGPGMGANAARAFHRAAFLPLPHGGGE